MKTLTAEDLVIGGKYVPHSKHTYNFSSLNRSTAWSQAVGKGQQYLFYTGKDDHGHSFWHEYPEDFHGDYFLPSDVTPYIEPGAEAKQYEAPATLSEFESDDSSVGDSKDFLPFNLQDALKSPERVVYRNGEKPLEWYHLKSSQEDGRKIISVTPLGNTRTHTINGSWNTGDPSEDDLLLLPLPKTTYYVNLMESMGCKLYVTGPWKSEAQALYEIGLPDRLIKTLKFEI